MKSITNVEVYATSPTRIPHTAGSFLHLIDSLTGEPYKAPPYTLHDAPTIEELPDEAWKVLAEHGWIYDTEDVASFWNGDTPSKTKEKTLEKLRLGHLEAFSLGRIAFVQRQINERRLEMSVNSDLIYGLQRTPSFKGAKDVMFDIRRENEEISEAMKATLVPRWTNQLHAYVREYDAIVWLKLQNPRGVDEKGKERIMRKRMVDVEEAVQMIGYWGDDEYDLMGFDEIKSAGHKRAQEHLPGKSNLALKRTRSMAFSSETTGMDSKPGKTKRIKTI